MTPLPILIESISRAELASLAEEGFGDMVKAVVDVQREVTAIGSELHWDEGAALHEDGANKRGPWGINLYPAESGDAWIEFDSMINIRPKEGNRSRNVEDGGVRERIRSIVAHWVVG